MDLIENVLREGFQDFANYVNPLIAKRVQISNEPMVITSTKNGQLLERDEKIIEDFHGTQAFGHRHPHITKRVMEFLTSDSANWFPSRVNPFSGFLAKKLCERSGFYTSAFFINSGSEAVESALKLARAVTHRPRILGLERAYHGCTMGSCSLMGESPYKNLFAPHLPGVQSLRFNDLAQLELELAKGDVAALIMEPIQIEGGVRELSAEYIKAACKLTEKFGTLLVADEIQTGMGRTGKFLASETWPRRPDAVLLGKHVGGGLAPLSVMLSHMSLFHKAYGRDFETSEAHNCTFSGSGLISVAGLAALEILDDQMIQSVADKGQHFRNEVRKHLAEFPLFADVQGQGMALGIVTKPIENPWLSFEHFGMEELKGRPTTGLLLCHRLYKRGYFCFVCGHDWSVIRIQPRFTIEKNEIDQFIQALKEEFDFLCQQN